MNKMGRRLAAVFAVLAFVTACTADETNSITEIGNPTTAGKGVTTALAGSMVGFVETVVNSLAAGTDLILMDTTPSAISACSWDTDAATIRCSCSLGGTVVVTYVNLPTESESGVTFDTAATTRFGYCRISSCGEEVRLTGEINGTISGSYNAVSNATDVTVTYTTNGECDDFAAGDTSIGLDAALTYNGTDAEATGTLCVNDEVTSFVSLEDLSAQLDPEGVCLE